MARGSQTATARGRWTWNVGRIFGIPIRIHFTLLLLLLWFAWIELQSGGEALGGSGDPAPGSWMAVALRVLFIAGLFASVLLHEIGHALIARTHGVRTNEITLYRLGGVARLRGMGTPHQELGIAFAGPLVNIGLAALLAFGLILSGQWVPLAEVTTRGVPLLQRLALANLVLAAFNLIPAFPMDGGRMLRSLLARRLGMLRGTAIAAAIGQGVAILFGLAGLLTGNFILVFIAFFVFLSASQELVAQRTSAATQGHAVTEAMVTRFEVLQHADSLGAAAERLLATHQQDFPVLAGEEILGVLTRPGLLRGLSQSGPTAYVAAAAERDFLRLEPQTPLAEALERMQAAGTQVALVFRGEYLVGMLTTENVREFFQLHAADT